MKTERIVSMPESTAVLIHKAFLPLNPNKLRLPNVDPARRDMIRQACRDFEAAIANATNPKVQP